MLPTTNITDSIRAGVNEWAKQIVTKIDVAPLLKKVADRSLFSCRPFSRKLAVIGRKHFSYYVHVVQPVFRLSLFQFLAI